MIAATYKQLWWPAFDRPVYVQRTPEWTGDGYCDPDTGAMLPTWAEALDQADTNPEARDRPPHVLRFGSRHDAQGLIAPSEDADRAVRYLTKYLAKSISTAYANPAVADPDYEAHVDRLHAELRYLPCSPQCGNWHATAFNPITPAPAQGFEPAIAPRRRMIGNISGSVAAASWSLDSGRAKR